MRVADPEIDAVVVGLDAVASKDLEHGARAASGVEHALGKAIGPRRRKERCVEISPVGADDESASVGSA
jgi:hypothetical protein